MSKLSAADWQNFWLYYAAEPHQQVAVQMLYEQMPNNLLQDDNAWVVRYRTKPPAPELKTLTPDAPYTQLVTPNFMYGELTLHEPARRFTNQGQCDIATEICEFLEEARAKFGSRSGSQAVTVHQQSTLPLVVPATASTCTTKAAVRWTLTRPPVTGWNSSVGAMKTGITHWVTA